jgi:uncharacterized Zn finger protein
MCKHVAAVLYGVGARFDHQPELLFQLRDVDEKELIAKAGTALPTARRAPTTEKVLAAEDLADVFGLDMASGTELDKHPKRVAIKRKSGKPSVAKRSPRKPPKK